MTKAAFIFLGFAALVFNPGSAPAQDNAAIGAADTEAVRRQADTLVLRQKLVDAGNEAQRGDTVGAAKLFQDACILAENIGSGIPEETTRAVAGLTATRLALARVAQNRGDLREADTQLKQILNEEKKLKVAPDLNEVQAFKKHNDELLVAYRGRIPDAETVDKIPQVVSDKVAASTLVQDGKVFYEMGKFDEAEIKLTQALQMDPDNRPATYYLDLIKQAKIHRDIINHNTDTQDRMEHVEKQWTLPKVTANIPAPNAYATNTLVWTGPGRQIIMSKLQHIHLDSVSFDGLPLSEVLKQLQAQCKIRDPERKGINFLINNNPDNSGQDLAAPTAGGFGLGGGVGGGGFGGGIGGGVGAGRYGNGGGVAGGAPNIDPNTGLPVAPAAEGGASDQPDVGTFTIKIPSLDDVTLQQVLDAIITVSDHPLKYSIQDFAVIFQAKGAETPQLITRTFKVDPNTFYSGLTSVSSYPLGFNSGSSSGGSGGGGGGSSGGNNFSTPVGVVNAFAGSGQNRSSGTTGGSGGGGGGGSQTGAGSLLNSTTGGGGQGGAGGGSALGSGGGGQNQGGLDYITVQTSAATPSQVAARFFISLGVNLAYPNGKAVFFNDRLGYLFVKATETDLDTIEQALQVLNQVPPQVHIKARFIEVSQSDDKQLGFDWYLGQFNLGDNKNIVAQGGNAGSLTTSSGGAFPTTSSGGAIATTGNQLFNSGLSSGTGSSTATITGIMTDPNFQVVLHALETRSGVENLGEPEITVLSGRQTQMRATTVKSIIVGVSFTQGQSATTTTGTSSTP